MLWKHETPIESQRAPYREAKRQLREGFNRDFLRRVLGKHNGSVTRAAQEAEMNEADFQRLMSKVGVKPGD